MSPSTHYRWATSGDTNAFFGLSLDNLADLTLAVSLLVTVFNYPLEFALSHFVPGTALGVIVGDLLFTWMAIRLSCKGFRRNLNSPNLIHTKRAIGGMENKINGKAKPAIIPLDIPSS